MTKPISKQEFLDLPENKKRTKKIRQDEVKLQQVIAEYLNSVYPDVAFQIETSSNVRLTIGQAVKIKKLQPRRFAVPDIVILTPRGFYHGLAIEVKLRDPWKKDGSGILKAYEEQLQTILHLRDQGYASDFVWSWLMAKKMIDEYLAVDGFHSSGRGHSSREPEPDEGKQNENKHE